jgi:hypothetical protein
VVQLQPQLLLCVHVDVISTDAYHNDGIPGILGILLVLEGGRHLRREEIESMPVRMELNVPKLGRVPYLSHLHLQLHHIVVGFGEHQPQHAPARVLDHRLESGQMLTHAKHGGHDGRLGMTKCGVTYKDSSTHWFAPHCRTRPPGHVD